MILSLLRPIPQNIGDVSQWFGENPKDYAPWGLAGHDGIDYAVPEGTLVLAAHAGICTVGWDENGYGQYIRINGPKFQTIYAHLRSVQVVTGTPVQAGDWIGESGNTGNSTGPHLHFGLKIHGMRNPAYRDWIDPVVFRDA